MKGLWLPERKVGPHGTTHRNYPPLARLAGIVATFAVATAALFSPAVARAEGSVDTWDGTADTGWYVAGSPQTEYTITTAEQLAGLAELVDDGAQFPGVTFTLETDLDLSGREWNSIGDLQGADFIGTFDGQGHTISGMTQVSSTADRGLFASIRCTTDEGAEVRDLILEDVQIDIEGSTALDFGALVGYASNRNGLNNPGQIRITNCSVSGVIRNDGETADPSSGSIGGILGFGNFNVQITGCSSDVDISYNETSIDPFAGLTVGGIVGSWGNGDVSAKIADCYFSGSISVVPKGGITAGILGLSAMHLTGENGSPIITHCVAAPSSISVPGTPNDSVYAPIATVCPGSQGAGNVSNNYWRASEDPGVYEVNMAAGGTVGPAADSSLYGSAVDDFSDPAIVTALNTNASAGVTWTGGVAGHPVFERQEELALADYSAVDEALAAIPVDLSPYTDDSVAAVTSARDAVVDDLPRTRQAEVDAMAKAIGDAIDALEYKPADYAAVDAAEAKADKIDRALYTDESLARLDAALDAVVRDKNITEQQAVDAMADAIEDALAALERLADYGAVDAAVAKAEGIDRSLYTEGTLAELDAAVAAVKRGYGETRQAEVDAMADAIEGALAALEEVPAPEPKPKPKPEQGADDEDTLPAAGDPTALLAPALGLVGVAALLARCRVA